MRTELFFSGAFGSRSSRTSLAHRASALPHCATCWTPRGRWPHKERRPVSGGVEHCSSGSVIGSNYVATSDDSLPPGGSRLGQAFVALVALLNERGVRYAIIGGLATIQHTRVRTTDDIDALLTVPQIALPA